jgi:hypothetical protein
MDVPRNGWISPQNGWMDDFLPRMGQFLDFNEFFDMMRDLFDTMCTMLSDGLLYTVGLISDSCMSAYVQLFVCSGLLCIVER